MKKVLLIVGLLMAMSFTVSAQPEASNALQNDKPEPATEGMAALQLASDLVKYGKDTEQALPLIQALQIMKSVTLTEGGFVKEEPTAADKDGAMILDYNAVLAQAKEFAAGDKTLMTLISDLDKVQRGRTTGETYHTDLVRANHTDVYTMRFVGGEKAEVAVVGDGDTDLDLYIYDENGNLIKSDTDYGDDCYVSWYPKWTGSFKVKIKNLGSISNRYVLLTN